MEKRPIRNKCSGSDLKRVRSEPGLTVQGGLLIQVRGVVLVGVGGVRGGRGVHLLLPAALVVPLWTDRGQRSDRHQLI